VVDGEENLSLLHQIPWRRVVVEDEEGYKCAAGPLCRHSPHVLPCPVTMSSKRLIAVLGATGAQGGAVSHPPESNTLIALKVLGCSIPLNTARI
jgi:hypothetical protein